GRQHHRNTDKREGISRAHAIEHGAEKARQPPRADQTQSKPDARQRKSVAHHHPEHIPGTRAKHHAHADLPLAQMDETGKYPVDTHGPEYQTKYSKAAEQHYEEAGARQR